ncbi:DUF3488 and transglutaminase-like domain-containing protein [Nocardioides sp. GY 10127]|uniref:DUF3488 and transglutaminase-like domain-containing protein n=1 Tax=Nocardioides sp. GY 10127 TaxID=2569762 RepID=UPI0010A838C5|nr:DUF3488 and transglutaminase-like domain-containing protein [Nocardioides sp. GY 10127]TIC80968.1 hypothetical protein E8D37_14180 [Nocardioides sp. GY 10127]
MSRRPSWAAALVSSLLAALTTWVACWGWSGFTEDPSAHLVPLAGLAVLVALLGGGGRALGLSSTVVVVAQVVLGACAVTYLLTGYPVPVGAGWDALDATMSRGVLAARAYAPPVATDAGLDAVLVVSGWWCLLLVDTLAGGLRRPALAALPLLVVFTLPVSILGATPPWWVFLATVLGWVLLLFLDASESVARWGTGLEEDAAPAGALGVRTAGVRLTAVGVGACAASLALAVPTALPALDVHLLDLGAGSGGNEVVIRNPMTDLRRDLHRDVDVPLVRVVTDDPDPRYLRIAVLTRFGQNEWTSGDRSIPTDQVADGSPLPLGGLSNAVRRTEHSYTLTVGEDLDSTWLPTFAPASSVTADGDWRYDAETMDFISTDPDVTTAGLTYTTTGLDLRLSADQLESGAAGTGGTSAVDARFTELPSDLPASVGELAREVTRGADTDLARAVALQDFFRRDFTYSLENVPTGNGVDALVAFLSTAPGGRVGYCEQFASAMAVMARSLGIPARVAVGFLAPTRLQDGSWEFSAYDMHAWPELYLPTAGWVRFEPTPASRASGVPSYTQLDPGTVQPSTGTSATAQPSAGETDPAQGRPSSDVASRAPDEEPQPDEAAAGADAPTGPPAWRTPLLVLLLALVVATLLAAPGRFRAVLRHRRLAGGPEGRWAELRAGVLDLGLPWPDGASPRAVGALLAARLADPGDDRERPVLGPEQNPGAAAALDRLVAAVELARYARPGSAAAQETGAGDAAGDVAGDVTTVLAGLAAGAGRRARARARWLPVSLVRRRRAHPSAPAPLDRVG